MDSEGFYKLGCCYTGHKKKHSKIIGTRRYKSFFGITPLVTSIVWQKTFSDLPAGLEPKHLLWCLNFLKQYNVEHTRRLIFKTDEKCMRKWTWIFINILANLDTVHLNIFYHEYFIITFF